MNLSLPLVWCALGLWPFSGPGPQEQIKRGNVGYAEGRFEEALSAYRDAQLDLPEDSVIDYNLGCAQYRLEEYEKASEAFRRAAMSTDPTIASRSHYNLGNALFRKGDLDGAIAAYQNALEIDENNEDARFNLELVRRKIKEMLDAAQKRQEEAKQGQSQGAQGEEQESSSQKGKEGGEEHPEEKSSSSAQSEGEMRREQDAGTQPEEPTQDRLSESTPTGGVSSTMRATPTGQESGSEEAEHGETMSPEDAVRLLEAIAQEEQDARQGQKQMHGRASASGGPDW